MSRTVTISDDLAVLVEARRRAAGNTTIDAAAEDLIARGLVADFEEDHSDDYTVEALRALIDDAKASGPAEPWNAAETRAEVLRRYAAHRNR